jgi:hypothetical protein
MYGGSMYMPGMGPSYVNMGASPYGMMAHRHSASFAHVPSGYLAVGMGAENFGANGMDVLGVDDDTPDALPTAATPAYFNNGAAGGDGNAQAAAAGAPAGVRRGSSISQASMGMGQPMMMMSPYGVPPGMMNPYGMMNPQFGFPGMPGYGMPPQQQQQFGFPGAGYGQAPMMGNTSYMAGSIQSASAEAAPGTEGPMYDLSTMQTQAANDE